MLVGEGSPWGAASAVSLKATSQRNQWAAVICTHTPSWVRPGAVVARFMLPLGAPANVSD
jgi:hypothetical protein